MIERLVPRNRPDEDTLGAGSGETSEFDERIKERVREQLDLRMRFAEAVKEKLSIPLSEALRTYTDLHIRLLNKWPGDSEASDVMWQNFVQNCDASQSHEDRVRLAADIYLANSAPRLDHTRDKYWPFRYGYKEKDNVIEIHFGKIRFEDDEDDGPGILSKERLEEQRRKLAAMFREIKEKYPDPSGMMAVRGASWLFNREAYKRLYPNSYVANPVVRKGKLNGAGTWGQFTSGSGDVNKQIKTRFLENLAHIDPDNLEAAFPYKTLIVQAPIADFYREYGIE